MAIFKCKMCGGALEINNNEGVAVCEYCGTKQTLPKLDDEKRAQLYDRANHFRLNNEFDKAMGIYEMILSDEKTDNEAYWGIVLCRYGIEYVEDPRTHRRIPTVNRAQFTSIFDDEDYKSALQYADSLQKNVYEAEAESIDKIQKGILAISSKEEPFDVFICYKESDATGNRTQDSVYAQDIYNALTKEGYKVFFSRITLEDKLGSAYEPYIFAALNSAKVMLVVGTNKDNFNAVWVKNEWSRYLNLIKAGKEKNLIPVYKDISPYDLPEEFQYLQAQDISKIGFIQDLVHGINKLIAPIQKSKKDVPEEDMYKQACSFLSKGVFTESVEYLDEAQKIFEQISNYKDSSKKIEICQSEALKIKKSKKRNKKIITIVSIVVVIGIVASLFCLPDLGDSADLSPDTTIYEEYVDEQYIDDETWVDLNDTTVISFDEQIPIEDVTASNDFVAPQTTISLYEAATEYMTEPPLTESPTVNTTKIVENRTYFDNITPGQKVKFGRYEQDGNTSNGSEELEWWAASVNSSERQALLICTSIVDYKPFNNSFSDVTWETSSIRKWLNSDFYNRAFDGNEKKWILDTKVANYDNPQDGTDCGADTFDKVFLLSYDEVARFYPDTATRSIPATNYARSKISTSSGRWWSRTSGMNGNSYALAYMPSRFMSTWGTIEVNDTEVGVVPVIVMSY